MVRYKFRHTLLPLLLLLLPLLFFWKILLTNLILVGVDTFLYFYPYKAYAAEALRQGRLPLWNPHLFMGTPLLANSQVGLFYPLNWPLIWLDAPKQVAWSIGLHIALAGLLMFLFAQRSLRLHPLAAFVAGLLFAFGGYLGAQVEHINQLNAAAWLPLLFLLYDLGQRQPNRNRGEATRSAPYLQKQAHEWPRPYLLWLAVVIALTLLAGHAQTVFISLFGLGLYALWQAVAMWPVFEANDDSPPSQPPPARGGSDNFPSGGEDRGGAKLPQTNLPISPSLISNLRSLSATLFTHLWPLAVASMVAVALAAVQLIPTAELSSRSIRSGGLSLREVVAFSLPPTTLHYTLLPPFGVDLAQVWGEAFGEWVAYIGLSGLILALLGTVVALRHPPARRFVFITACGLILSLGLYSGPIYAALYYLFPGFGLFRVPARWLLLYSFGVAALAGFGFNALLNSHSLREELTQTGRWLAARWWRLMVSRAPHRSVQPRSSVYSGCVLSLSKGCDCALLIMFIGLPALFLLTLILWHRPPWLTLAIWGGLVLLTLGLILYALRFPFFRTKHRPGPTLIAPLFILLIIAELFLAAQSLSYNRPTAPQAYHSLRNAVAFLLAADPPDEARPPARFLSLSGITYDPGDLGDLEQLYGPALSDSALYNFIVTTKQKEVLFFNLPLLYKLHSVDGYDGGILPLARFVTLQRLFLPADDLSIDGRLREKLQFVPPGRLLSLLNTRWIITDKMFDAWIDDIFYDLQFPARLGPGQQIATAHIPDFPATAIGLVSHLAGAADLPAATEVAAVTLTFADGQTERLILTAGDDTAEGNYPADAAHPQATIGQPWPYEAAGVDYVTVREVGQRPQITHIRVEALLPAGQFVLRGLSLIHQPTTTSRSVLLSTEGTYRPVHSGDVKIYENLGVLPRAFIVHQAEIVQDEEQALALMEAPTFDPTESFVQIVPGRESETLIAGEVTAKEEAVVVNYEPERVEIAATLASPGWLVLTDTHYPGWQVTVNGQAADIIEANLMFRAVALPAGEQIITFRYQPRSLRIGALISAVTLALTGGGLVWSRIKK